MHEMHEDEVIFSRQQEPVVAKTEQSGPGPWEAYLYHREHGARLFNDPDEFRKAMATGEWFDSPAKFEQDEDQPEEGEGQGDEFTPLSKRAITRMKVDERREWAMKWFGAQYAEGTPADEIINDLLARQAEKAGV